MRMNPEEMIARARWLAESLPECDLCGCLEGLFQIGCCTVCKNCLAEHLFDNLDNPESCEALRLYVDSDPNAGDWFCEYFEDRKIPQTWY